MDATSHAPPSLWSRLDTSRTWKLFILAAALLGLFFHFYALQVLPMGLYIDEQSIGYNAYLISKTLADEHGVRLPLFFQAFGEYKSPIYIYTLSAVYRILGYSEWTTRVVSAGFWVLGSGALYGLARRLFSDGATRFYIVLCLAFTPWIFVLSRLAFDFMVVYALLAIHLNALHRGFEGHSPKFALLAGVSIAVCVYAYTAFRLLSPLHCALILGCYLAPKYRKELIVFATGAFITVIPYLLFSLSHFDVLTKRFEQITYLGTSQFSSLEKIGFFIKIYTGFFSPSFLLLVGDPNHRHHTGFGGQLFIITVILFCSAVIWLKNNRSDRFAWYLMTSIPLSPIAASMTYAYHNAPRAFSMVVFLILVSGYGMQVLKPSLKLIGAALTVLHATLYVYHFQTRYGPISAMAFENYGFKEVLHQAISLSPKRVILSKDGNVPYINLRFFGGLAKTSVPLLVGSREDIQPGDVYIYYEMSTSQLEQYRLETH